MLAMAASIAPLARRRGSNGSVDGERRAASQIQNATKRTHGAIRIGVKVAVANGTRPRTVSDKGSFGSNEGGVSGTGARAAATGPTGGRGEPGDPTPPFANGFPAPPKSRP